MSDYKTQFHLLLPNRGGNVHCLNGSDHILRTSRKSATTCLKCLRIANHESTATEETRLETAKRENKTTELTESII